MSHLDMAEPARRVTVVPSQDCARTTPRTSTTRSCTAIRLLTCGPDLRAATTGAWTTDTAEHWTADRVGRWLPPPSPRARTHSSSHAVDSDGSLLPPHLHVRRAEQVTSMAAAMATATGGPEDLRVDVRDSERPGVLAGVPAHLEKSAGWPGCGWPYRTITRARSPHCGALPGRGASPISAGWPRGGPTMLTVWSIGWSSGTGRAAATPAGCPPGSTATACRWPSGSRCATVDGLRSPGPGSRSSRSNSTTPQRVVPPAAN